MSQLELTGLIVQGIKPSLRKYLIQTNIVSPNELMELASVEGRSDDYRTRTTSKDSSFQKHPAKESGCTSEKFNSKIPISTKSLLYMQGKSLESGLP